MMDFSTLSPADRMVVIGWIYFTLAGLLSVWLLVKWIRFCRSESAANGDGSKRAARGDDFGEK